MRKLSHDQLMTAINKHAEDNKRLGGRLVEFTLEEDLYTYVKYSDKMWDEGVPVTKYFDRNDEIPLFIPSGTKLYGMAFVGQVSHSTIVDFYYGGTWYEYIGADNLIGEELSEEIQDSVLF